MVLEKDKCLKISILESMKGRCEKRKRDMKRRIADLLK